MQLQLPRYETLLKYHRKSMMHISTLSNFLPTKLSLIACQPNTEAPADISNHFDCTQHELISPGFMRITRGRAKDDHHSCRINDGHLAECAFGGFMRRSLLTSANKPFPGEHRQNLQNGLARHLRVKLQDASVLSYGRIPNLIHVIGLSWQYILPKMDHSKVHAPQASLSECKLSSSSRC